MDAAVQLLNYPITECLTPNPFQNLGTIPASSLQQIVPASVPGNTLHNDTAGCGRNCKGVILCNDSSDFRVFQN